MNALNCDNREVMLGLNAVITDPPFNTGQMRKDSKIREDKEQTKQLGLSRRVHTPQITGSNPVTAKLKWLRYANNTQEFAA